MHDKSATACYKQECDCQYDVIMITFDALQMQQEADLLVFNDENCKIAF